MENTERQQGSANRGFSAPVAGLFLIITAIATLVAVVTRVSANADHPTPPETLSAIADSRLLYGTGGIARFVSGATLLVAGWLLLRTWVVKERFGNPMVPAILAISGIITAVSGACALVLSITAQATVAADNIGAITEGVEVARWLSGKIGFAVAGLALLVAARQQWKAGASIKRIAPLSAVVGIGMQLIWWDAATIVHRITGIAFLVWLLLIGFMLVTGRVERHFVSKAISDPRP